MSNKQASWVKLEEDAYYAVLRALAVSELNWEKEKLLTDLRSVLHITNDQHFKFLEEVMSDKLVTRLRSQSANGDGGLPTNTANAMPPPPPRQQTPAGPNARKHVRPSSAGPKFPPANSPAAQRPHRLSESSIGADRRSRSAKRSEDFEVSGRAGGSKSARGLHSQRSRGRGRRIISLPKDQPPAVPVVQPRAKRKMFASEYVKKIIESGSEAEVSSLYSQLEAQARAIDHHISLIDQLDDDDLADRDAAKFCRLAIEELEMATEMIDAESAMLQSSDEEATQD